ncbi:hypothetical protein [Haloechinothrix salitolerans]|uniref:DUF320 domain-containing protein n=1 Tax=Haloechinothrix salitolerans TaxID=926830 RepID=A0ABW2BWN9_9PSEU
MSHTRRKSYAAVAALAAAGGLLFGASPAAAHGGSVTPPSEQQDCRNLALHDKGEGENAQEGTNTAGENGAAVEGGHCD